jgi:integrase
VALMKEAGLGHPRFHDLRHAHATVLLQHGVHPKIVSERLGHAGVTITLDTYSHVLPNLQAEAVALLDTLLAPQNALAGNWQMVGKTPKERKERACNRGN